MLLITSTHLLSIYCVQSPLARDMDPAVMQFLTLFGRLSQKQKKRNSKITQASMC